jgi:DeoR/GlpR family transcriptional regulator of sugar metabolism
MNSAVRQRRIREMLDSEEFLDLDTLSQRLEVSDSTIRRDLVALEGEGVVRRVYGGAMALQPREHILDFAWQSTRMAEEKRRIAALAASLVQENETVILDGGSTVAEAARALAGRSLQVITNSLPIAEVFSNARQVEVILTGGYLYPRLRSMLGPVCEHMLANVTADVLVMGIGGVTASGLSNSNTLVVEPERKMIEAARKVIILADHTKFGRNSVIHLAPLDVADIVVSDTSLAPEFQDMLKTAGVEVLLA